VVCAESTDSNVKSRLKTRMLEYIERAEKLKDAIQKRKEGNTENICFVSVTINYRYYTRIISYSITFSLLL